MHLLPIISYSWTISWNLLEIFLEKFKSLRFLVFFFLQNLFSPFPRGININADTKSLRLAAFICRRSS